MSVRDDWLVGTLRLVFTAALAVGATLTLASCGTVGGGTQTPERVQHSATLQAKRGADAIASTFEWTVGQSAFLSAVPVEGVSLGCTGFRRDFIAPDGSSTITDAGSVYIQNDTGKTMYESVATIDNVSADVDGVVRASFAQTRFEYGDIANGSGAPSAAGPSNAQEWSYVFRPEETSETYIDNLEFTVTVSWLADP